MKPRTRLPYTIASPPADDDHSAEAERWRRIDKAARKAAREALRKRPIPPDVTRDIVNVIFKDD